MKLVMVTDDGNKEEEKGRRLSAIYESLTIRSEFI